MPLNPSAYLILGMIRAGVGTGYAIKRAVDRSTRFFWSTSFAQVYPELARLEDAGYIVGQDIPQGSRPRRVYELTTRGDDSLRDWLQSKRLPSFEFRDEALLRLFFADALAPEEAHALITRLRTQAEQALEAFEQDVLPGAEETTEQRLSFPYVTARLGHDYLAWRANWFCQLENELQPNTSETRSATER